MAKYFISIVPIFIYLLLLIYFDVFSTIKKKRVIIAFAWGVVICFTTSLLDYFTSFLDVFKNGVPLFEELIKIILIVFFLKTNKMAFLSDSLIYGASVGAGFSLIENISYAYYLQSEPMSIYLYRGFATSLLHFGTTALASVLIINLYQRKSGSFFNRHSYFVSAIAIIPSVIIHYLHNLFIVDPKISLLIVIIGTFTGFITLFSVNKKHIHKWMEAALNNEVFLLSSFKANTFSTTEAGKLLISVKQQFQPMVYFDMVVYVNLYLELSISAKGFFMMKEAEIPIPEDEKKAYQYKAKELLELRKNIGRTALFTLAPIIDTKHLDTIVHLFN